MILPVYVYGNDVLRQPTEEITPDYPDLNQLIENMWETMYSAEGIGLAAPQIGRPIRLMVIDADPMGDDFPECRGFKKVFINPTIISTDGDDVSITEGCLSLPGISEKVTRPTEVTLKYMDTEFKEQMVTFKGFAARVFLHEFDHIEQTLFVDRISPLRKRMIKSKLQKISKGQYSAHYRTVSKRK